MEIIIMTPFEAILDEIRVTVGKAQTKYDKYVALTQSALFSYYASEDGIITPEEKRKIDEFRRDVIKKIDKNRI